MFWLHHQFPDIEIPILHGRDCTIWFAFRSVVLFSRSVLNGKVLKMPIVPTCSDRALGDGTKNLPFENIWCFLNESQFPSPKAVVGNCLNLLNAKKKISRPVIC